MNLAGRSASRDGGAPAPLARRLWQRVEMLHAVVYFDRRVADAVASTGVHGWWAGYVAGRAAPLGRVAPGVVEALFFGFSAERIARGLPSAWESVEPADLVEVRRRAAGAALGDHLSGSSDELDRALASMAVAIDGCSLSGRGLFAAHASSADPVDRAELLWHRCTLLREHRGDGHVAACVAEGLDGVRVHHLAIARGVVPPGEAQRLNRGWTVEQWQDGLDRLTRDGLLVDGELTASGAELVRRIEDRTDAASCEAVRALGADRTRELIARLDPWVDSVQRSGIVPFPNAMGLTHRGEGDVD